jgi:carotenoid 1,2-hydratase
MSARFAVPPLPQRRGAYLWLYSDAVVGDVTAVCIFLVGSVFSPRYVGRAGRPLDHCAVNFALYRRGRRVAWAFTEYPGIAHAGTHALRIGSSTLAYRPDGSLVLEIAERTAPWRRPLRARLALTPVSASTAALPLDAERLHRWEPRVVRATARLQVPALGIDGTGLGYHDANRGDVPLGGRLPGWWWARVHTADASLVRYGVHGHPSEIEVTTRDGEEPLVVSAPTAVRGRRRSAWGLVLPTDIGAGTRPIAAGRLLESSPFYARQEARADGVHALGESADFRRFRSPLIRWMAYFRMRTERAA